MTTALDILIILIAVGVGIWVCHLLGSVIREALEPDEVSVEEWQRGARMLAEAENAAAEWIRQNPDFGAPRQSSSQD